MVLSKLWRASAASVVLALLALIAPDARAFDVFWVPTGTSNWNTPANWSSGSVPTAFFEETARTQ